MSTDQLSAYTFNTKYARYNKELKRRETFEEAVDRVMKMHREKYKDKGITDDLDFVTAAIKEKLVLGSQRALQFAGVPIVKTNAKIFNCSASYCDRVRFFQENMWMLLCGCGVGFSVQKHHVEKLPTVVKRSDQHVTYVADDSIEGWADCVGVLMSSYFSADQTFPEYAGKTVEFDLSKIRPEGAPITGGSKAPGPEPLRRSLGLIENMLELHIATKGDDTKLSPIECYDIIMHSSDAVLAGGVRRSATICLFSKDDEEMLNAKTGNWFQENPQRSRSNNSALLLRNSTSREEFLKCMEAVKEFGEPGFVWADSTEILYNPCCEIGLYPVDITTGESGWQTCNLTEINMKLCTTEEKFFEACKASAILGTLQAGYNEFKYLGKTTENICRREALLGCSMTGMCDSPDVAFNADTQRKGASIIRSENERIAALIGINPAARTTCVKPAGSTSCVLGTSSGIHPHHASRYFRRVQTNKNEAPAEYFKLHNPLAVEKSLWNPNGTDLVITFCVETPEEAINKAEVRATDLLRKVKLTQNNWVAAGKNPALCTAPFIDHNVSNTISVKPEEWEKVSKYIYDNRASFAGISLLPSGGDLDFKQAPFVEVWTSEEIHEEYGVGSMMASGLIVDGLRAFNEDLWLGCDITLGIAKIKQPMFPESTETKVLAQYTKDIKKYTEQIDWVRRAKKFAANYFNNNIREMCYCLKRVHNCKLWEDLTRTCVDVDYTLLTEEEDNTKPMETVACGGAGCELK